MDKLLKATIVIVGLKNDVINDMKDVSWTFDILWTF